MPATDPPAVLILGYARPKTAAAPPRSREVEVVTFSEPGRTAPTSTMPGGKRKFLSADITKIYATPNRCHTAHGGGSRVLRLTPADGRAGQGRERG